MSDGRASNNDPSMDDILASIRKIISDDEARAQVGGQAASPSAANNDPVPAGEIPPVPPRRDDVLLLTDIIDETKEMQSHAETASISLPQVDPMPPAAPVFTPPPEPRIDPVRAPVMANNSSEPLIGASVAGATSSAFDRLNQAMQNTTPTPVTVDPGPSMGVGSSKTIEEMVQDMLRPMLKDWLDRNLPPIVERYVEREIVRLTRR
jgi:hypothetical protein